MQHCERRPGEIVGGDLEQLIARIVLEDLQQVLTRMAGLGEPQPPKQLTRLPPQDGDLMDALVVGGRCEQSEESALPYDVALLIERLDADVVEVGRPVNRRAAVGLGDDEQLALTRAITGLARESADVGSL